MIKREKRTLNIPVDLINQIQQFANENYIATFNGALVQVLILGLEKDRENKDKEEENEKQ